MSLSYAELLAKGRAWYKMIRSVYCPILGKFITFNAKGFHHLLFDGQGKARVQKERMYRLGLLPLIIPVLKQAKKIEEYTPPTYSKQLNKMVEYWRLTAIVGKRASEITVVLRKIGTGQITFYSVWKKPDKIKNQKTASRTDL